MKRGPARFCRLHTLEAKAGQVQLFDEYIDNAYRVVLSNVVVQQLGQERALSPIFASYPAVGLSIAPCLSRKRCARCGAVHCLGQRGLPTLPPSARRSGCRCHRS